VSPVEESAGEDGRREKKKGGVAGSTDMRPVCKPARECYGSQLVSQAAWVARYYAIELAI
jgi:hypothetical protein